MGCEWISVLPVDFMDYKGTVVSVSLSSPSGLAEEF